MILCAYDFRKKPRNAWLFCFVYDEVSKVMRRSERRLVFGFPRVHLRCLVVIAPYEFSDLVKLRCLPKSFQDVDNSKILIEENNRGIAQLIVEKRGGE